MGEWTIKIITFALIRRLTAVNYVVVKFGSKFHNASMFAKPIPIGIIMVLGLFMGKVSPDLSLVPKAGDVNFSSDENEIKDIVVEKAMLGWEFLYERYRCEY